jgi:hypothetical protein
VPSHQGVWLDKDEGIEASGPEAVEQRPKGTVQRRQAKPTAVLALQCFQLMTQCHDFELQGSPILEAARQGVNEGAKNCCHALDVMSLELETPGFLPRTEFLEGTSHLGNPGLHSQDPNRTL